MLGVENIIYCLELDLGYRPKDELKMTYRMSMPLYENPTIFGAFLLMEA